MTFLLVSIICKSSYFYARIQGRKAIMQCLDFLLLPFSSSPSSFTATLGSFSKSFKLDIHIIYHPSSSPLIVPSIFFSSSKRQTFQAIFPVNMPKKLQLFDSYISFLPLHLKTSSLRISSVQTKLHLTAFQAPLMSMLTMYHFHTLGQSKRSGSWSSCSKFDSAKCCLTWRML